MVSGYIGMQTVNFLESEIFLEVLNSECGFTKMKMVRKYPQKFFKSGLMVYINLNW